MALALETFQEELAGRMASFVIDNAGALAGFIKGASKSTEQNIIIGESWMFFARRQIALQFWRVGRARQIVPTALRDTISVSWNQWEQLRLPQFCRLTLYSLWKVASEKHL